jgi:hypothetical protein
VVQLVFLGSQAGLDISETLSIGELSKRHAEVVVETGKVLDLEVALIPLDALVKGMERKIFHHLRENELPGIHDDTSRALLHEGVDVSGKFSSRLMA